MFSDYDPDGDFEDEDRPLRRVVQAFTVLLLLLAFAVVLWFALERKHDEVEPDRNRSTSEQVEVSEDVENDGVEGKISPLSSCFEELEAWSLCLESCPSCPMKRSDGVTKPNET